MLETTVGEYSLWKHAQHAAVVDELACRTWQAVQSNPPCYTTQECKPVRVLLEGCEFVIRSRIHFDECTIISIGILGAPAASDLYRFVLAHELAHAYAPPAKRYTHSTRREHDSDPLEKYADDIAGRVVPGYSREAFYKEV